MSQPPRTLAQWLTLQEQVHSLSIDLGLERVGKVARRLGVQRPPYRVITVAGTNGKGSTVADLEAVLRGPCGLVTGALTSPHLLRYNERIRIAGEEATDAELTGVFARIEAARGTTTLTFFEYNTLAALLLFAERGVQTAVLEVGLGGRLDATNLVDADVGVLCSVGFDHRDWLGDTLESIGAEKAGIFRAGRPAVLGTAQMPRSVYTAIEALGAHAVIAERDFSWDIAAKSWSYQGLANQLSDLPAPVLAGNIQYRNAATALAAVEALLPAQPLAAAAVAAALQGVRLPGRFQIIPGPVQWILDVAHNEPAAAILAENLRAHPCKGRTLAVCGILMDKDAPAIGRQLAGLADVWIVCSLPGPRGCSAQELARRLDGILPVSACAETVAAGCERARALARAADRVLVFGSFSTVTAALEWLQLY